MRSWPIERDVPVFRQQYVSKSTIAHVSKHTATACIIKGFKSRDFVVVVTHSKISAFIKDC